ncbi:polysaccharide deacetylase family protein [Mucilaginibacter gynuensis]|uniref:Polysaccharide deacetylase family protein n=1 Tax=Mucilaginibacter gynuensis TaxID=1302236 RepID=A0ABP8H6Q7_9SPHI
MILLSFDVEEFDLPLEYGKTLDFERQLNVSTQGTITILDMLQRRGIKATFFVTANYAVNRPEIIARIVNEGHELASHGYYHSDFKDEHLLQSKLALEQLSGATVSGFRMARMMPVNLAELKNSGYTYNSSINPTWLPGRYNHLDKPRTRYMEQGTLQLPSSVTPAMRFPLFWLSFHNLPMWLVKQMCYRTYKKDGYLNIYFHPWEFTDLKNPDYGLPSYISRNSGNAFTERIEGFIKWAQEIGIGFERTDVLNNDMIAAEVV